MPYSRIIQLEKKINYFVEILWGLIVLQLHSPIALVFILIEEEIISLRKVRPDVFNSFINNLSFFLIE
jgi:hypothetical protein